MTTKVVKIDNAVRMITGKLAPYIEMDWANYSLNQLGTLLEHVVRFEIEHNYTRHKDYKDKKGANIEVFQAGHTLTVKSLGDELLIIQDGNYAL